MSRIAYVNGRYVPHRRAVVHIEDRGYQFGDGVYEVCRVDFGAAIDLSRHLDRLQRSLGELRMAMPIRRSALMVVIGEVIHRNRVADGLVYIQVTRGVAPRNHAIPPPTTPTSLVVSARSVPRAQGEAKAATGVAVVTVPDNRWERVDIKTTGLLPNVLARQYAIESGCEEAWFVDDEGYVTEGAATSAWIVTRDGILVTRPDTSGILPGITRRTVLDICADENLRVEERRFTVEEAQAAREAFATAASAVVMPVVSIDGKAIANGAPGSIATRLRARYHDLAEAVTL